MRKSKPQDIPALWRARREELGLTFKDLAMRVGWRTPGAIQPYLLSKHQPGAKQAGIELAARINAALDLSVADNEKISD